MDLMILDTNFDLVSVIDVFESSLWTDRFFKAGDFEIYTLVNSVLLNSLKEDYYVQIEASEHTMIIEDRQIASDVEDGSKLITTGRSLEYILDRRIIWGQVVVSGNLQDGIEALINAHIISPTDPDRQISNFIFEASTDPNVTGLTIETQFINTSLYEAIQTMCEEKKIGFKVILDPITKQFKFSLYAGEDRSYDQDINPHVVFSPNFENLRNSNYLESKRSLKTVAVVIGDGTGSDRKEITVESPSGAGTGLTRREVKIDATDVYVTVDGVTQTDVEYEAQLAQKGLEVLSELGLVTSFEGEIEPLGNFTYGEDFFMGDVVQIENEYGITSTSRVVEIVRSESTAGVDIIPTFATIDN